MKYMTWCFGLVNNRLAEIYFEEKKGVNEIIGHTYVNKSEYKSRQEKQWIAKDTAKVKLSFKNGKYRRLKEK